MTKCFTTLEVERYKLGTLMKKKISFSRTVGSAIVQGKYNGSVIIDPKYKFSKRYLPHGKGICTYKDGQIYKGIWKRGKRHGKGKLNWSNGDIYLGDWKNDKPNGKGKFFFKQGFADMKKSDSYIGQVKDWLRHGRGTYTWVKQSMKYTGIWKNGKRHGYGEYKEDDSIYKGQWKDDRRWGKGKITIKKQHSISGNFRHTDLKGKVTMDFWKPVHITYDIKARKYVGNIHNETFQPHGRGIYILKNKKVVIGKWNNGKLLDGKTYHKKFVSYWKNGKIFKTKILKKVV